MGVRMKEAMFVSVCLQHRKEKARTVLKPSENFVRTVTLSHDSLLRFNN